MNEKFESLIAKVLIVVGLALLALLAVRTVFGILRGVLVFAVAIAALWIGARLLANRIPDE